MRLSRLALMLSACTIGGCSASAGDSKSTSGDIYSGQTGSLIPSCGAVPALVEVQPVPSGDAAFVLHTAECTAAPSPERFRILDVTGNEVPVEFETVDGALLARTGEVLSPGTYRIVTPEGDAFFEVTGPEPLPVRLGDLRALSGEGCGATLELVFDDAALSYTSLLRIDVSVDGGEKEPWFDYGMLDVDDGTALLRLERCMPTCFGSGNHRITLHPTIAGESAAPDPLSTNVVVDCTNGVDGGGCTLSPRRTRAPWAASVATLLCALFAGFRRRRR